MQVGEGEEASPLPASTSIDTKKKLMQLIILIQLTLNERYIRSFPFCWTNDASYVAFWQTKKIRVGSRGGGVYAELNAQTKIINLGQPGEAVLGLDKGTKAEFFFTKKIKRTSKIDGLKNQNNSEDRTVLLFKHFYQREKKNMPVIERKKTYTALIT